MTVGLTAQTLYSTVINYTMILHILYQYCIAYLLNNIRLFSSSLLLLYTFMYLCIESCGEFLCAQIVRGEIYVYIYSMEIYLFAAASSTCQFVHFNSGKQTFNVIVIRYVIVFTVQGSLNHW